MLALLVAALCASAPFRACLAADQAISYGPEPAQILDICKPQAAHGLAPAVLMIHGGGWSGGSRLGQFRKCTLLAAQGMVAIPVDYRLSTGTPGTIWPAQMQDVQLALRWVRAHAAEYGIDPGHICAEGESAGGHLALMLGVVPGIAPGDMQSVLPNMSPHANCVVSISGPTDLEKIAVSRPLMIANLFGRMNAARFQSLEADGSPALRARGGSVVPTLLIQGLNDPVVPFPQATEMQAALIQGGAPSWLVTYQGGHVLKGLSGQQDVAIFGMIGRFVRAMRLPGAPRQMPLEEALGGAP